MSPGGAGSEGQPGAAGATAAEPASALPGLVQPACPCLAIQSLIWPPGGHFYLIREGQIRECEGFCCDEDECEAQRYAVTHLVKEVYNWSSPGLQPALFRLTSGSPC